MSAFVYRNWDGSQRLEPFDADDLLGAVADDLLGAVADDLLAGEDLEDVLSRLMRWGHPERLEGLQELLERLRDARRRNLERHQLNSVVDDIQKRLEDVVNTERSGIEERKQRPAPNEQLREAFDKMASEREQKLNELPDDPAGKIRELQQYEFIEPKAQEKFQEL
ncbi:MAG: VWA domain-containing protein, partial [Chloroflexi bacterium]